MRKTTKVLRRLGGILWWIILFIVLVAGVTILLVLFRSTGHPGH